MKIKYLKLVNYKRFPLLDVELFEQHFNSKLVTIIGCNGSGKSSFISELTPLPADKNNFYKNGYKEIHVEHDKKLFKLISDFRDGTHFSFLINDIEQNTANNITAQRDLVFLYFTINQSIQDILTGVETFTEMSLLSRKKLFSTITHINIDKVLENYNHLKEELKSNEFLLKTQTTLYQNEEQKLINASHLEQLKENLTRTKNHIDFLLDLRTSLYSYKESSSTSDLYEKVKAIQLKLEEAINKYYIHLTAFPKGNLEQYKLQYSSQLNLTNYQLDEFYKQLEQKQDELKVLALTQQSNLQTLQDEKYNKEITYTKLLTTLNFLTIPTNNYLTPIQSDLYKLEVSLPEILRTIKLNPVTDLGRTYTREKYDTLLSTKKELLDKLTTLSSKEHTITKELKELSSTNDTVSCPNCSHTWSLKDIPKAIQHLKEEHQSILQQKLSIQTQLQTNEKQIEDFIEYFNLYKQYTNLKQSTLSNLKPFWEFIDQELLIFNDPPSILKHLNNLGLDLCSIETAIGLQKEIEILSKNIEVLSTYKNTSFQQVEQFIEELNNTVQDLHSFKDSLNTSLQLITKVSSLYDYLERLNNALKTSSELLYSHNLSTTTSELLNVIETDLSKYKVLLIEHEKELSQYETIQYTLSKYKKTIEDTQSNIKVLKIILDELSPKNGLIAKSVSSFLNIIITNINKTIASIWNYKMILKPIDIDNESLNYRFKVEVEDKLVIEDISKCSAGMRKLINFCFVKLLYKLLDLEDYPLFLDEFNVNLDTEHSYKFAKIVKDIIESGYHSQLFIISHLSNDYHFKESDMQIISLES